jgi:hypothetical protein
MFDFIAAVTNIDRYASFSQTDVDYRDESTPHAEQNKKIRRHAEDDASTRFQEKHLADDGYMVVRVN